MKSSAGRVQSSGNVVQEEDDVQDGENWTLCVRKYTQKKGRRGNGDHVKGGAKGTRSRVRDRRREATSNGGTEKERSFTKPQKAFETHQPFKKSITSPLVEPAEKRLRTFPFKQTQNKAVEVTGSEQMGEKASMISTNKLTKGPLEIAGEHSSTQPHDKMPGTDVSVDYKSKQFYSHAKADGQNVNRDSTLSRKPTFVEMVSKSLDPERKVVTVFLHEEHSSALGNDAEANLQKKRGRRRGRKWNRRRNRAPGELTWEERIRSGASERRRVEQNLSWKCDANGHWHNGDGDAGKKGKGGGNRTCSADFKRCESANSMPPFPSMRKGRIQFSPWTMTRTVALLVSCLILVHALDMNNQVESNRNKQKGVGPVKTAKDDCMKVGDRLGCACTVCKDVVKFTRIMILDHVPTEEQVLDKVCRRIFKSDESKERLCEDIVKSELPEMIKYVKERIDPHKVCKKFC
nr:Saposin type B domain containing protein [Haemonchus contortus]